ncbi:rckA [Scenedesmus sp. PABB004]|nr:rckA [Scenedesmus sp. PABB004]
MCPAAPSEQQRSMDAGGPSHKLCATDLVTLSAKDYARRFKVASKLGAGSFADVLRVRDAEAGAERALKVLRPPAAGAGAAAHGLHSEVALFREARALKHARHANVVELLAVLRIPPSSGGDGGKGGGGGGGHGSRWALLLEYVSGGSLAGAIYERMVAPHVPSYSTLAALQWGVDVAAGLAHLHGLTPMIIHRDLKLANILLQRDAHAGRRVAKLSDFGLHVMLDRSPRPFYITSEGGCPMLVFAGQQPGGGSGGGGGGEPQRQPATPEPSGHGACAPVPASDDSSGSADGGGGRCGCERHAPALAGRADGGGDAGPFASAACAGLPGAGGARPPRHVAFREAGSGGPGALAAITSGEVLTTADLLALQRSGSTSERAAAACCDAWQRGAADAGAGSCSAPLPELAPGAADAPAPARESLPLTTGAIRRLSVDGGAHPGGVPLLLAPPGERGPGSAGSYVKASVPADVLRGLAPGPGGAAWRSLGAPPVAGESVAEMLAAANAERDAEVSLHGGTEGLAGARARRGGAPAATAAACGSDLRSTSARSSDFPTAASMLWEDLMEEEGCCQDVLGGEGFAAPALAYDLTSHTGSCMYMAPEVHAAQPYNEKADVFSLGVILYELFGRVLLFYTHTPANSPDDALAYAARVAGGFRPERPRSMPQGVWDVVSRCWAHDPAARPSAAWVLQQLQQLLDAEEAAGAAAPPAGGLAGLRAAVMGRRSAPRAVDASGAPMAPRSASAPATAGGDDGGAAGAAAADAVADVSSLAGSGGAAGPKPRAAAAAPGAERGEPSACGCIIC